MADSSVSVTPGSGATIDSRTESTNGHHRQVVVIGDPATTAGVAPVDATAGLKVDLGADNDVVVSSSALPTGAATSAKQDTAQTALDAIKTAVEALDNAVSGNEFQVDVLTMPTVTVQATNLDVRDIDKASDDILIYANTAKDGSGTSYVPLVDTDGHLQVDVLSGGGSGTEYTEDAIAAANPVGGVNILVRADTPAGIASADGDNVAQRGSDYGAAYVTLVDDGGNFVSVGGGTQYDEDTASADAQKLTMAGVTRADTAASQVGTDGDRSTLIVDASGRLHVNVGASALPTGAATSAKQDTVIGHLDGVEGLLGTIDTDTGNIDTKLGDLSKAEDAAHSSGDKGIMFLGVTNESFTNFSAAADLDYVPLAVERHGALHVLGTFENDIKTAVQLIDDAIVADDAAFTPATTKVMMAGFEFDDTAPDSVNEGDAGAARMSANRNVYTQIRDAAGNERGANVNASNELLVALSSVPSHAVTNAGTFAVQDSTVATNTGNAATSLGVMDDWDNGASDGASVSGDVAHDTADAGEPVKVGFKAVDIGANPTDVAAADRSNAYGLRNGVSLQLGGAPNIVTKNLNITDADGAQTDTALVTVSAGTAIVVTAIQVYVDAATTATGGVAVRIGFGTANVPAADSNGIVFAHPGIAAGSGAVVGNGGGIIGMGASNEDLRVTCEDPAGGNIDIIISYFTIAIG